MSHVKTIDLEIKDLDSLEVAAKELGLELVRGATSYKWYGRYMGDYNDPGLAKMGITPNDLGKCTHKLRVVGANSNTYEIGLIQHEGTWRLLFDFYAGGGGLMEKVSRVGARGEDVDKLKQEYATQVAIRQLRKQGMRVQRSVTADGKVRLVAQR